MKVMRKFVFSALPVFLVLLTGNIFGGSLTDVSWTSTNKDPGATGVSYTWTYTITTGSPYRILYLSMPYYYSNNQQYPFDLSGVSASTDITVKVNGVEKPIDVANTWPKKTNEILIKLSNPADATAGATITVIINNAKNNADAGVYDWIWPGQGFVATANDSGQPIDKAASVDPGSLTLGDPVPPDPTGASASTNPVCTGGAVDLTATGTITTAKWYTGSCGGTYLGEGNPYQVHPTETTTYYVKNFSNNIGSANCASVTVNVEQNAVSATITKSPDQSYVCSGSGVSATFSGGSGGNGTDTYEYSNSSDGNWYTYTPGNNLNTDGKSYVKVRTRRTASQCSNASYNEATWNVYPAFNTGAISTSGETICYGSSPSVMIGNSTSGSGGNGTITYSWRSSVNNYATNISGANSSTYTPAGPLTSTRSYRRYVHDGYCNTTPTASTGTWTVTVSPTTVPGSVSGGTLVCYGSHSTLLSLSGQTGAVLNWQYSNDSSNWNNISASTQTTYTTVNLTQNRWYRTVVKSGVCLTEYSSPTKLTMVYYQISGNANYNNNPQTTLSGLKIVLSQKFTGGSWTKKDSVVTNNAGYYEFSGLTNAQYSLNVKSAHPSGQWQTWGGVNNTDAAVVLAHINNTMPLVVNPPVVRVVANVKTSIPSAINNDDYNAIRQAAKFGWGYFDIPKWAFSGLDANTRIDTFSLACSDVIRDIRGLCAGDVNGSYIPATGYKNGAGTCHDAGTCPGAGTCHDAGTCHGMSIQLVHEGNLPVADEMVFPMRMGAFVGARHGVPQQMGAITLFLDYDPSEIEITNVTMPENGGEEPVFDTRNGILYIGWVSENPIFVNENQGFILIHARLTESSRVTQHVPSRSTTIGHDLTFTLNNNPLSELADALGNVISDVRLTMPVSNTVGTCHGISQRGKMEVVNVYPNPARDLVNVEIMAETEGIIKVVFSDLTGRSVSTEQVFNINSGLTHIKLETSNFPAGVYMLKISDGIGSEVRKVVVNN